MAFSKDKFTLFFSIEPDAVDFANLLNSRVRRVMLPFELAVHAPAILDSLAHHDIRVVLRMAGEQDTSTEGLAALRRVVQSLLRRATVDALILGPNEPENGVEMRYGYPWEQLRAYDHRHKLALLRDACSGLGVRLVAPGWTNRSISEDDYPQPGVIAWREICAQEYQACAGVGCHIYGYGWQGPVDVWRAKVALKRWQELWHLPLWIDEFNINSGTQVERMRACIEFADLLLTHKLGQRVELFTPFISNGVPNGAWDIGYLMRDPTCYAMLGDWMTSN